MLSCPTCRLSLTPDRTACPHCGCVLAPRRAAASSVPAVALPHKLGASILMLNALANLALPALGGAGDPIDRHLIAPSAVDLLLGMAVFAGSMGALRFVRFRVVLGAIAFGAIHVASGAPELAVAQGAFSLLLLGLLVGNAGRIRVAICSLGAVAFAAAIGLGLETELRGKSALGGMLLEASEDLLPIEDARVSGVEFSYSIARPGAGWRLRTPENARRENPLADRWLLQPEYDASVMVIVEPLEPGIAVDVDMLVSAVVDNGKALTETFELTGRKPTFSETEIGERLTASATFQGSPMRFVYGVFPKEGYAVQIVCIAHEATADELRDTFDRVIRSFRMRGDATSL